MHRSLSALALPVVLTGCAGLEIETLTSDQVKKARSDPGHALKGYVVYEPVVVVEISVKDACLAGKDEKDKCKAPTVVQCAASIPFLLPDYAKPYLVRSKNGLGKAGVDVAITDGWRLGSIKDNSDNTAVLGTIEKLLGVQSMGSDSKGSQCLDPGLYQVTTDQGMPKLTPIKLYGPVSLPRDGLR